MKVLRLLAFLLMAVAVSVIPVRAEKAMSCIVRDAVRSWSATIPTAVPTGSKSSVAYVRAEAQDVEDRLTALCLQSPSDAPSAEWLTRADDASESLWALAAEISANKALRGGLSTYALAYGSYLNPLRVQAYNRVTVQTKEVVRTVEVPAQCPEPAPPRETPCNVALRQGADRWSTQLYSWTRDYDGSGGDYALAWSSKSELNSIAHGSGDPASYVLGWLARWHTVKQSQSFLGSGPMPGIAADMRAQLQLCGIALTPGY